MDVVKAIWIVDVDCGYSVVEIHGYRITGVLGLISGPVLTYLLLTSTLKFHYRNSSC